MRQTFLTSLLFFIFSFTSYAPVIILLDTPQDVSEVRRKVQELPEVKRLSVDYSTVIKVKLWPLKINQIAKIFGPKLLKRPDSAVLPIFAPNSVGLSGLRHPEPELNKNHVDLHAIADIGFVEFYYQIDGETIATAGFWHKADSKFVPLKTLDDSTKRLEWDKAQFERIEKWLEEHVPK